MTIDMWLDEGTRIEKTDSISQEIIAYIASFDEVEVVNSFVGQAPPRYYLASSSFGPQSNYANFLIKCNNSKEGVKLKRELVDSLQIKFNEPFIKINSFELNMPPEALIEARFLGPDEIVLDSLVDVALNIMRKNNKTRGVRNEWGNMAMMIKPVYDPVKAGTLGVTKADMMESIKSIGDGVVVGLYRDQEKKIPVLIKSDVSNQMSLTTLGNFSIWNGSKSAPLSQVVERLETTWEYPCVRTYNRQLSMAAMSGVVEGATMMEVHSEIKDEIENIKVPDGYTFFWDSQLKDQNEAMAALAMFFPLLFLEISNNQ